MAPPSSEPSDGADLPASGSSSPGEGEDVARLADGLAGERAIVIGTPPPRGRDLDLLVRPRARSALVSGFERRGFLRAGDRLAGFRGGNAAVIELAAVADRRLPQEEEDRVFAEAPLLPGYECLALPATHHVLLLAALALADQPWGLKDSQAERVRAALSEDPAAFEVAAERAAAWRAEAALRHLRRLVEDGALPGPLARAAARRERDGSVSPASLLPLPAAARGLLRPHRRGFVIALSGLDGCGKSSQAELIRNAMDASGHPTEVVWDSLIAPQTSLQRVAGSLARGARAVTGAARRTPPPAAPPAEAPAAGSRDDADAKPPPLDPAAAGRLSNLSGWRGKLVAHGWTMVLAGGLGGRLARATWPRVLEGRIVVCDRYLLDAAVEMRYFYGERGFRAQRALLELLTPRPRLQYLIDIDPATASRRKAEFSAEQNVRRIRLYRELGERAAIRTVAGTDPPEKIAERLCAEAWLAANGA